MLLDSGLAGLSSALHEMLSKACRADIRRDLIAEDPVQFPRRFSSRGDREVVALVSAFLAFGRVRGFLPKIENLLERMGSSPCAFVLGFVPDREAAFFEGFRSRVYRGEDLRLLFLNLRAILEKHGSLERALLERGGRGAGRDAEPDLGRETQDPSQGRAGKGPLPTPPFPPLAAGRRRLQARLEALAGLFYQREPLRALGLAEYPRSYRHLVVDPSKGSAAKRWSLFLRWVVRPRDDGVDLGLWRGVDPADLVVPLDTHVARIGGLLGLSGRKTLDRRAAEEITDALARVAPGDPLRFDFALSHVGISSGCRGRWVAPICGSCHLKGSCREARRR